MARLRKIRNLFRRKPLTEDELRRRAEAESVKEQLGDLKTGSFSASGPRDGWRP